MDHVDFAAAAATLRAVADGVIRAEDVVADPIELAYLHGAADALELASDRCPDFLKPGPSAEDHQSDQFGQDDVSR